MTASPNAYRTPYVSQMLKEPDRTWDDCCASVTIMLGNDWTLGEWSIRDDGKPRDLLFLRNLIRKRIGDTDGGLTLHDANDMLHELDPDLPDLPRYNGQATKPGQSAAGATLRLDRDALKAMLRNGYSAAVCGLSGTVGHVVYFTDGNDTGPIRKDPLTAHGPDWVGARVTWAELWRFTEAKVNGERAYGSPSAIACAIVKVGEETEAARAERNAGKLIARLARQVTDQKAQTALANDERDTARRELASSVETVKTQDTIIRSQGQRIAELEAATPQDCNAELDRALTAERKVSDALAVLTR
jgi:hypothetical protein